jgi:hypothetical protein
LDHALGLRSKDGDLNPIAVQVLLLKHY